MTTTQPAGIDLSDYVYSIDAGRNRVTVKRGDWGTSGRSLTFALDTLEALDASPTWDTPELIARHRAVAEYHVADEPRRRAHIEDVSKLPVVYLRLGELPEGGLSYNYREGHHEAGVSCYRAYQGKGVVYVDCVDGCDPMVLLAGSGNTRPWYIISGDVVGEGSDGEPVLANAQVIKKLSRKPTVRVLFPATSAGDLFWTWAK